jgi:regulator of sigma E protease
MSQVMGVVSAVFWGVVILSILVFVHEGGHFLVARAFGVRVTEFFLGMPCRVKLSRRSKRYGTEYGITPILLGGYNRICGMEGDEDEFMAAVLECVMRHGRVDVATVASEVGCTEDQALASLVTLSDWASVAPFYDPDKGEKPTQRYYPQQFETVQRDDRLLTAYDKDHDFTREGTSAQGEARTVDLDADELLSSERSHTYRGMGFWRRALMLVAGAAVNIACGFVLVVGVLMIAGVPTNTGANAISGVVDGSVAANAGLQADDVITSVGTTDVTDWNELVSALTTQLSTGTDFDVTIERGGSQETLHVTVEGQDTSQFGIYAQQARTRLSLGPAVSYTSSYIGIVATYVVNLLVPAHAQEVIDNSTSIVGISVMASQAASQGADELALFAAAISLSLGFMNLLPIPPLDGGKLLLEAISAVTRRPIPAKVQNVISYVGLALFMLLFFYMLRQDILRFVIG